MQLMEELFMLLMLALYKLLCFSCYIYVPKEDCFFELPSQNLSNGIDVQLVFKDNSADVLGSVYIVL